jgi:hypothetical protein
MIDETPSRYSGDWNMNQDFLKYIAFLITRTGAYAEQENAKGWLITLEELYRDTGGIVKQVEFKTRLNEIKKRLQTVPLIKRSEADAINFSAIQGEVLSMLDVWQIDYIGEMHRHNLILPKSDKRRGLKQMEEELGISDNIS